jgi:hypothetical protein
MKKSLNIHIGIIHSSTLPPPKPAYSRDDEEVYIWTNGILHWMTGPFQKADRSDGITIHLASSCNRNVAKVFDYHSQFKKYWLVYHGDANLDLETHQS